MIPNPYPGKFFVFEGGDGCGKTLQLDMIFDQLDGRIPCQVLKTKEPGKDRLFGKKIYNDLFTPGGLHETDPHRFQMWYACDSKEHMQKIVIPALNAESIVLSDRFRPSMVFGARNETEIGTLMNINKSILGEHFIWPDAILIFNVSVETAIKRSKNKGRLLDGHENKTVLERVLKSYKFFSRNYPNCHLINAERPPEEISKDVMKIITPILKSQNKPA